MAFIVLDCEQNNFLRQTAGQNRLILSQIYLSKKVDKIKKFFFHFEAAVFSFKRVEKNSNRLLSFHTTFFQRKSNLGKLVFEQRFLSIPQFIFNYFFEIPLLKPTFSTVSHRSGIDISELSVIIYSLPNFWSTLY